jgi:hypothetical protein
VVQPDVGRVGAGEQTQRDVGSTHLLELPPPIPSESGVDVQVRPAERKVRVEVHPVVADPVERHRIRVFRRVLVDLHLLVPRT